MNIYCDRTLLMNAINIASRATAPKSPIPSLEGILLEASESTLQLTGYDMKKGVYTSIEAEIREPGSIVLGAKIFGDIVRALPNGMVNLRTTEGNNVKITCEKSDFSIVGTDASEYPELPAVDSNLGVYLPQNILGQMIRETLFAVSDNEARPIYTGALFEIDKGCLTVVAIDGYRLALRREAVDGVENPCSFVVPGKSLSDLEKLCADTEESVKIILGSKHISFTIGRTVLVSRRLDGDFLNYHKAIPNTFAVNVEVDKGLFTRCVERVSLIIDDKVKNPIRCMFEDNFVRMACATALGKAEDVCMVDGDGKKIEIGFNNRYLLDALKAAPASELKISLNSGSSPCVITPAEEGKDNFLYMILPVRLKAD